MNLQKNSGADEAIGDIVQSHLAESQIKIKDRKIDPDMKFFVEANFHRANLLQIKKALGKRCSFLAHRESKGKHYIKAVMVNETGGKDTVEFLIAGTPEDMTEDDYRELYTELNTMNYVARSSS